MTKEGSEFKKTLLEIGFSQKEADVYIAILVLGQGTASKIAREAHIVRTTVYDILGSLFDKGLVTLTGKEPKQEYVAESPDNLEVSIKEQLEKKKKDLYEVEKSLIPQLKSIHNKGNRPKVMFYEGKDGLEKVYEDTLSSHEEILAYASVEDINPALPHYFPLYYKRTAAKGIPIKAILPESLEARERASFNEEEKRKSAIVPKKYGFHPEINIYDNKVMIASWREKLGIIIESAEIADAMKKVFQLAWAEAERLDREIRQKYL